MRMLTFLPWRVYELIKLKRFPDTLSIKKMSIIRKECVTNLRIPRAASGIPTVVPTFMSKGDSQIEEEALQNLFYLGANIFFWEQTYKKAWSHVKDILWRESGILNIE